MKNQWNPLFTVMVFLMLYGCGKVEHTDNLIANTESFSRATSIEIMGQVIDPETREPVIGAEICTPSFSVITDMNGEFKVRVTSYSDTEAVLVNRNGHIRYEFAVDYTTLQDGDEISWQIFLPQRERSFLINSFIRAVYTFEANDTEYHVEIPSGTVGPFTRIIVSQGGLAFGPGIRQVFGLPGVNIETTDTMNCAIFRNPITVEYDLNSVLTNYLSLPIDNSALVGQEAALGGESNSEVSEIVYGMDLTVESGDVRVTNNIGGNVIPRIGTVINGTFYDNEISQNPEPFIAEAPNDSIPNANDCVGMCRLSGGVTLTGNLDGVNGIPHQSTGDGG